MDLNPAAVRKGHDSQLEKAVEVILQLMKECPVPSHPRPLFPDRHKDGDLVLNQGPARAGPPVL